MTSKKTNSSIDKDILKILQRAFDLGILVGSIEFVKTIHKDELRDLSHNKDYTNLLDSADKAKNQLILAVKKVCPDIEDLEIVLDVMEVSNNEVSDSGKSCSSSKRNRTRTRSPKPGRSNSNNRKTSTKSGKRSK